MSAKEDNYYLNKERLEKIKDEDDEFDNDLAQKQINSGFISTEYAWIRDEHDDDEWL